MCQMVLYRYRIMNRNRIVSGTLVSLLPSPCLLERVCPISTNHSRFLFHSIATYSKTRGSKQILTYVWSKRKEETPCQQASHFHANTTTSPNPLQPSIHEQGTKEKQPKRQLFLSASVDDSKSTWFVCSFPSLEYFYSSSPSSR